MRLLNKASIRLLVVACIATLSSGCASTFESINDSINPLANLEPWVKPYERSNLADPIMSMNRNPVALAYAKHVFESREGARGADGGAGGGCGCN
ncbi:DUF4266 domain-containing protein [Brumicola pallidula]|jgi:hypothetical protein|uniref:DUF4266 domain-containing protein n=1 Tax=Brumicola pallidula DSM 14239 = ACAM 615 TaxID=1121922 RepID=K6ZMU1_9ALTE|nr:DUF4266 domain-containing protein [Glaciecola pallidula]GAC30203.1 hypothetical protein GPAL_3355 [Glaciecola pallidula DSM 14239 = ACAM 615]